MQQVQGDDDETSRSTVPIDLWHETGVRETTAIIKAQRIASITSPYPGEFLLSRNHQMFRKMGGFKGGGVLLRFVWDGPRLDVPHTLADQSGPDILADVFQDADPTGPSEGARAGGFHWKGTDGTYWCSRIYRTRGPGLRLVGVEAREIGRGSDSQSNIHRDPATPEVLARLTALIGVGLDIAIDGSPLSVADIRALSPGQAPPSSNFLSRIFRGGKLESRAAKVNNLAAGLHRIRH
jgi:hypothetical protein